MSASEKRIPIYRSNWTVRSGVRARRAIASMARDQQLDALFVHTFVPAALSRDWMRKVPTIISVEATPGQIDALGHEYEHRVHGRALERLKHTAHTQGIRRAARVITWSAWAASAVEREFGVASDRISVIPPGVDLETWAAPAGIERGEDETVRILFVGGDLDRKGGRRLLDAVRRLRSEPGLAPLELHLVTRTAVRPEPWLVVHNDLSPNEKRLLDLFHRSDIFCLPSEGDCLPMALAEAGAAGLPLLSTAVGAIPELVRPHISGELIPPRDTDALVAALRRLIVDADRRRALGSGAAELVRVDHDARRNAASIVDVMIAAR
jgi:glycosyltransferase involved in cell wall biosynthesis